MNSISFPLPPRVCFLAAVCVAMNITSAFGQIRVLPPDEVAARVPQFTEVNFEDVNLGTAAPIVRTDGVIVRRSALERCNTCPQDPGDTNRGNVQLVLQPGGGGSGDGDGAPANGIRFALLPRFVVLEMAQTPAATFGLRVTDGAGRRWVEEGATSESPFGLESAYGVRELEVTSVEGADALKMPRIFVHNAPPPLRLIAGPVWSTQVNLTW